MEVDSNLASLFQTLTMADPLTAPRSWDSVPSEGALFPSPNSNTNSGDQIHQPSSVTEHALVCLALNALQGMKASLVELEEISDTFCSIPADRTNQTIPNLWFHGSSTSALGHFLRSIYSTGLKVFFIQEFINFYLYPTRNENEGKSPFSLVNQAFTVSIRNLLEGYLCALNTLSASVGLRRSSNQNCCSDITLLEVYMHTEELRRFVESIGNICFTKHLGLDLGREDLNTETVMDFHKFFRGAELLSYLYMQLQDADPMHYGLLKYLFVRSFEPYWEFIKSWIYQAKLNDPYEEFFLACPDGIAVSHSFLASEYELSQFVEERSNVSLPYFLGDVSGPILRTGEQLHVLVKLLSFCNFSFVERGSSSGGTFPCWFSVTPSHNSSFLLNSLTFSEKSIETLVSEREALYKSLMEKLKDIQLKFDASSKWVIPFHTKHGIHHRFQDTHYSNTDSADIEADLNTSVDAENNEAAYTSDESLYGAQFEKASMCSSLYDSEEELATLDVSISPPKHANACERLFSSQISSNLNDQTVQIKDPTEQNRKHEELHNDMGAISDSMIENNQTLSCWPLGSLLENPFVSNRNCIALEDMWSVVDEEEPVLSEGFQTFLVMNGLQGVQPKGKSSFVSRNYNLGANPILTKVIWPRNAEFGDGNCVAKQGFLGPVFDFSFVKTPSGNFSEKFVTDSSLLKEPLAVTCPIESKHLVKPNVSWMKTQPNLCPSREVQVQKSGKVDVSGGAQWTGSLGYPSKAVECIGDSDCWHGLDPACEMPLNLVIYKCIMQEILLQYKYVSNFTLKLLQEGFDLDDHFRALRRYHFMEMADWADYLVDSLFNQTWSHLQAEHSIAEVQGLLDLALQRSSCESDPYRERLFVYVKEDKIAFSGFESGLSIFDCIMLGFRVDWPVTIVITQEALNIYAEIFGCLSQIRFSLFSLTSTWNFLKGFVKANKSPGVTKELNAFLRVRQKISHFVSTLLQYVHSQLSDVSWCRFQHSLKHQAKDMLDLRSMHMSYLQEALHICFLSAETKPIAAIIRSILQCAIDLSSCFTRVGSSSDKHTLRSLLNFPEVSAINTRFESHLKDLHLLYMNSPKHGELSLCRLWGYLNYNNCYSFASFPF